MAIKDKNLLFSLERERFSNFVVDLRKIEKKATRDIRKEEKKIRERGQISFRRLSRVTDKINFNLLREPENLFRRLRKFRLGLVFRNLNNYLHWSAFIKQARTISSLAPAPKSFWRKFVDDQERIFKAAPRPNAASQTERQRLDTAESQVFWYRSLLSFIIVLILIIIPFKLLAYFQIFDFKNWEKKIVARSEFAFSNLLAATDSASNLDFKEANSKFQAAGVNFLAAESDLNKINDLVLSLAAFSDNPKIKLAAESKKFLRLGALSASLGSNLAQATGSLFSESELDFSRRLDNFLLYGQTAARDAQSLQEVLASIKNVNLPTEYQAKFVALSQQSDLLVNNLVNFINLADNLKELLGRSSDKRYLVVFQNNSELRASGGFIGSYALVDFKNGRINNLEVPGGGSYDTEGGLELRVVPPEPLSLVSPLWYFWDANWWPDWPTTAQNLMWFYSKSGGPSVDGVIGLTPTVLEGLLEITGPINLQSEYGLTIDAANFWETVQKITEQKNLAKTNPYSIVGLPTTTVPVKSNWPLKQDLEINAANKPKKIIGDLLVKILEILPQKLTRENLVKMMALFEENMAAKQIMLYFKNESLQAGIASQNWAGEMRSSDHDYLAVIHTNIAGQKSDRLMSEKIDLKSEVQVDGSIINTLKIQRTHQGVEGVALTGVRNVDWLRIYVPLNSELLLAAGFKKPETKYFQPQPVGDLESLALLSNERAAVTNETTGTKIYQEKDKTVFANWVMIDPGETAVITIQYRLPFNFFASAAKSGWLAVFNRYLNPEFGNLFPYSLLVQKQAGAPPSELTSQLILPASSQIFWRYPDFLKGSAGWDFQEILDRDKYWSILVKDSNY
ncbi:MAG: DUF4012 domain-containing protein [Patescibacteria group bacterium]